MKDGVLRGIPLGRLATPDDVAAAAHFLNTDAAPSLPALYCPSTAGTLPLTLVGPSARLTRRVPIVSARQPMTAWRRRSRS